MISLKVYKELKDRFGKNSSWAIWAEPQNGNWHSKDSVSSMDLFANEESLCKVLNPNYIFVGLNPAEHDNLSSDNSDWCNFHSSDTRRSQDYKLRYALWNTPYWGSFITDVYPEIRETDSAKVTKKASTLETNNSLENLLYVRTLLGGSSTIIAMGSKSYAILKKSLQKENLLSSIMLKKITHYAHRVNIDAYREIVRNQLQ